MRRGDRREHQSLDVSSSRAISRAWVIVVEGMVKASRKPIIAPFNDSIAIIF